LRGNFISRVHVPAPAVRARKNLLRQRLWLTRLRTMTRNRIHSLIDRHPRVERPVFTDLFGKRGLSWLNRIKLPAGERAVLDDELQLHALLQTQVKTMEERIGKALGSNRVARRLQTLPGVCGVLAPLIALEIDKPERFETADKLCAYAGLVPITHASGGKITHGDILPFCNKWLRWAFVEAAWTAVACSDYFGRFYKRHRARGKLPNNAIIITARRMAKIAWQMLHEKRDYMPAPPPGKTLSPAAPEES
jgi:transposase